MGVYVGRKQNRPHRVSLYDETVLPKCVVTAAMLCLVVVP